MKIEISGVVGLLGILFVGLKLTHYIDWSWWWVTLPFWGGIAVAICVGIFLFAVVITEHFLHK